MAGSKDREHFQWGGRQAGKLAEQAYQIVQAIRKKGDAVLHSTNPEVFVTTVREVTGVSLGYVEVPSLRKGAGLSWGYTVDNFGNTVMGEAKRILDERKAYRMWIAAEENGMPLEFLGAPTDEQ